MLVLERRTGQRIMIGNDIVLTFEGHRGYKASFRVNKPGISKSYSLYVNDKVQIADQVFIAYTHRKTVSRISIGIEAPKSTPINREEVYQRIQQGIPHPNAKEYELQVKQDAA